jgi:hypothetical protein
MTIFKLKEAQRLAAQLVPRAMSIGEPALAKQNCSNLLYEQF